MAAVRPSLAQKIQRLVEDLKAYRPEKIILFGSAARGEAEHSVKVLAQKCGRYDSAFEASAERWKLLDQFCIPTRYPDALAGTAVPFESYTVEQAEGAIEPALEILEGVRAKLSG